MLQATSSPAALPSSRLTAPKATGANGLAGVSSENSMSQKPAETREWDIALPVKRKLGCLLTAQSGCIFKQTRRPVSGQRAVGTRNRAQSTRKWSRLPSPRDAFFRANKEGIFILDYLLSIAETMLLVICVILFIRRYNRNAERKEIRNPVRFHFTFGRNKFPMREDSLYTPNRKINRHWRP